MRIHQGKAGGPDVSNATDSSGLFVADAAGLMKITCEGNPGESLRVPLSAAHKQHKTCALTQTQKSNATFGWSDAAGRMQVGGIGHSQQKVMNYDASMNKPAGFPRYDTDGYLTVSIGPDGKPTTYTLELGAKL
jgi:hypothetical protein